MCTRFMIFKTFSQPNTVRYRRSCFFTYARMERLFSTALKVNMSAITSSSTIRSTISSARIKSFVALQH